MNHKPLSKVLKVHCFNWVQKCIYDDNTPITKDGVKVIVPYIDPIPGGFALEHKPNYIYWSDNTIWYWDTMKIYTNGKKGEYSLQSTLKANTESSILKFIDTPFIKKGCSIKFNTWLVALNNKYELQNGFIGFTWGVEKNENGIISVDLDENSLGPFTLDKIKDTFI